MNPLYSNYGLYLWLGLVGLTALLLVWLITLQLQVGRALWHYRRLVRDVDRGNLEDVLEHQLQLTERMAEEVAELSRGSRSLGETLHHALQRVAVVRFNPFQDTGSDQSFCVALLDDMGDGVVLTSIFSREGCRTYAKPILSGQSKYPLSSEEREAIKQARIGVPGKSADTLVG
ncbi:MAG: DUF4446 family protein [Bacteroidetes bacterium]|nr:DUF4446 family protein [Bacteroidota bacterium]MCL5025447.1 DUF4446 family protein [Chloroflexota bacterium]